MAKPQVTIYTDGGATPNPGLGGWGALLLFTKADGTTVEKELSGALPKTTNNVMELTAVAEALESLTMPCQVTLYADSDYVVKGMNEWIKGWIRNDWMRKQWKGNGFEPVANVELWQRIYEQTKIHTVTFLWVKAHAGIEHNERVDGLVHQARATYKRNQLKG